MIERPIAAIEQGVDPADHRKPIGGRDRTALATGRLARGHPRLIFPAFPTLSQRAASVALRARVEGLRRVLL